MPHRRVEGLPVGPDTLMAECNGDVALVRQVQALAREGNKAPMAIEDTEKYRQMRAALAANPDPAFGRALARNSAKAARRLVEDLRDFAADGLPNLDESQLSDLQPQAADLADRIDAAIVDRGI